MSDHFFIFLFIFGLGLVAISPSAANRVLLREISSVTLRRGAMTTGRRSSPVAQLECVGGTAHGKYSPKVVQCYNRGWDGKDVQWECKAEMSKDFRFGGIEVSCEGYDYPNDPYVLAGSCGLRYELDYTAEGARKATYDYGFPVATKWGAWFRFESIVYLLFGMFVLYLLYLMLWGGDGRTAAGATRFGGGSGGGGGYPPNDGPPPPGWSPPRPSAPPPYDDTCGGGPSNSSSEPGFFSGLGLGALGGYLFGRNNDGGYYGGGGYGYGNGFRYRRPWGSSYYGGGGGWADSGPSTSSGGGSSSSSETHTSSGYGGTSRR